MSVKQYNQDYHTPLALNTLLLGGSARQAVIISYQDLARAGLAFGPTKLLLRYILLHQIKACTY